VVGNFFVELQKAVARAILRDEGAVLHEALLEPVPGLADLAMVACCGWGNVFGCILGNLGTTAMVARGQ